MADAKIVLSADSGPLRRELQRGIAALKQFGVRALETAVGVRLANANAADFARSLTLGAKAAIDMADSLAKMSQRVGVSVQTLTALRLAGELSDVSLEVLSGGLRTLAKRMDEATRGTGEGAEAFRRMGLRAANTDGTLRRTEDVLAEIAEEFQAMPDGAQKTALAMELFGDAGAQLIPLLNQGRAGLEEMRREAERLGIVLDENTARAAEAFNDNLTRLKVASQGLATQIATGMLPSLESLSSGLAGSAKAGERWQSIGRGLGNIFSTLARGGVFVGRVFFELGNAIGAGAAALASVLRGDFAGAARIMAERNADARRAGEELLAQLARMTEAAKVQGAERVSAERKSAADFIALKRAERDQLVAVLASQVAAEKQAVKDIEAARKRLADVQRENARFLAELQAAQRPAGGEVQGIDIARQLAAARDAFQRGNLEDAAAATEQVKKNLLELARAGTESGDVLNVLGREAARLDEAIAQTGLKRLEDQLVEIRKRIDETFGKAIDLRFDISAAKESLEAALKSLQEQAEKGITVPVRTAPIGTGEQFAGGGLLRGPGSDRSDNLLAWLSPGEYVVRAAAVRHYGAQFLERLNTMALPRFAGGGLASRLQLPRFAEGGPTNRGATINLTLGELGPFPVQATEDVASAIVSAVRREALKRGARR